MIMVIGVICVHHANVKAPSQNIASATIKLFGNGANVKTTRLCKYLVLFKINNSIINIAIASID